MCVRLSQAPPKVTAGAGGPQQPRPARPRRGKPTQSRGRGRQHRGVRTHGCRAGAAGGRLLARLPRGGRGGWWAPRAKPLQPKLQPGSPGAAPPAPLTGHPGCGGFPPSRVSLGGMGGGGSGLPLPATTPWGGEGRAPRCVVPPPARLPQAAPSPAGRVPGWALTPAALPCRRRRRFPAPPCHFLSCRPAPGPARPRRG